MFISVSLHWLFHCNDQRTGHNVTHRHTHRHSLLKLRILVLVVSGGFLLFSDEIFLNIDKSKVPAKSKVEQVVLLKSQALKNLNRP